MSTLDLRLAQPADATALAAFARRSFVETFVEDLGVPYPAADLAVFLATTCSAARFEALMGDADTRVWILGLGEAVDAYAVAGPNALPHPDAVAGERELKRFYLAKLLQGTGAATAMMEDIMPWLAPHEDARAWLGVWSGNLRAQRFYARWGFRKVGECEYPVGNWRDLEFVFRRGC